MIITAAVFVLAGCSTQQSIMISSVPGNKIESMSSVDREGNNKEQEVVPSQAYTIKTELYTSRVISNEDIINVKYPQIVGLEDPLREEAINELILKDLIENEIEYFAHGFSENDVYDLDLDYQITMQTPEVLSILFQGSSKYCTGIGAGFPDARDSCYNSFNIYALNIDLVNAVKLKLTDFTEINEKLLKDLEQSSDYTNPLLEGKFITKEELYNMMPKEYSGLIRLIEGQYYNTFCITPDSYIISVEISPIIGNYVLITVPRDTAQ